MRLDSRHRLTPTADRAVEREIIYHPPEHPHSGLAQRIIERSVPHVEPADWRDLYPETARAIDDTRARARELRALADRHSNETPEGRLLLAQARINAPLPEPAQAIYLMKLRDAIARSDADVIVLREAPITND